MQEAIAYLRGKIEKKQDEIKSLVWAWEQCEEINDTTKMQEIDSEIRYLEIEMYALVETAAELEDRAA